MMYCQTIRIDRDISRDDRAIIATCSLRTLTDRLKENYSIDYYADRRQVYNYWKGWGWVGKINGTLHNQVEK